MGANGDAMAVDISGTLGESEAKKSSCPMKKNLECPYVNLEKFRRRLELRQ
jgi:hypothetical protein